ncbi:MAG: ABC transporter permease [Erysipelotrichia bacterium]|nr:ABC transporter permease [Erysipelotrichia bacterium]NCC54618.1 ABC transporter permease [Erysipelotrichia bacterium]
MISLTLFKKEIKANYKIMLLFLAIVSLYSSVVVAMFDPKLGKSLEMMAQSMPELFAAFGMNATGTTLIEFVANYLYGFILIVIPLIFIILMCSRLLTRYLDKGSMAYLLATPNTRTKIIVTQILTSLLAIIFLVLYTMLLIVVCGILFFNEIIDMQAFILVNAGWLGLLVFLSGMCFLSATLFNESKLSIGVGVGLSIVFVLIQMLSQVGDQLECLKYATPLTLFQVDQLVAKDVNAIMCMLVLYGLGIVMYMLAIIIFKKKDLSL